MIEFDLKEYLSRYKNTSIDFFRFPGNYGDSLIWHGTKKLLLSLNIREQYVDISSPKYNDVLFIDGGGNFVDYYSDIKDFLIKKTTLYKEVVILPHTIFGEKQVEILNNVSSKVTVFCRERVSAKFLEDRLKQAEIYLWHDCAFYNEFVQVPEGNGVINAFRLDIESVSNIKPESNNDLSYDGYATKPLHELIETLQKYEQVNTDRLHIAIAATLLGKEVKLFPNSYYKNNAVFEYSLKRFSNVKFVEDVNNQ